MPRGATAAEVAAFLSPCCDDAGCACLCVTAGTRTRQEEDGVGMATRSIGGSAFVAHKQLPTPNEMIRRVS
jgi:hypothetical protein